MRDVCIPDSGNTNESRNFRNQLPIDGRLLEMECAEGYRIVRRDARSVWGGTRGHFWPVPERGRKSLAVLGSDRLGGYQMPRLLWVSERQKQLLAVRPRARRSFAQIIEVAV